MRKLLLVLSLIALVAGGWYFASPWLAMKGLVDDAQAGDLAGLEERIDFPRLRESTRENLQGAIADNSGQGGLLEGLGGVIAGRIADEAINRMLTPEGMATVVVTGGVAASFVPERFRSQELDWDVEREGLDAFRAISTFEDGTPGPILEFERDGLGWDVVGVTLQGP